MWQRDIFVFKTDTTAVQKYVEALLDSIIMHYEVGGYTTFIFAKKSFPISAHKVSIYTELIHVYLCAQQCD